MIRILVMAAIFLAGFSFTQAQESTPLEVPVVVSSWWQIADEDYDAGFYNNKPGRGEPTLREHQQVSDFTVYRAANGKWQLVSAVRATKYPGGRHFLYRWESDKLTDENWTEKGIFYTTQNFPEEAGYTEGILFAPHCILHEGTYYLFHNSDRTARVLISSDGIDFSPFRDEKGSYVLFNAGEAGRDLMVMDNRMQDGLWYIYYAAYDAQRPELASRQFTDIYLRTATDLKGPWSAPEPAGMGTPDRPESNEHAPANFVNAESPFVIYRNGFYYKFEQAHVVASKDPKDFKDKPVVANLFPHFSYPGDWWPALAPEVIRDGEKMYIACFVNHHEHPLATLKQGGVFVAELGWKKFEKQ